MARTITTGSTVEVIGLAELKRALKRMDSAAPRSMRRRLTKAGNIVRDEARARVPVDTGAARRGIKTQAGATSAVVKSTTRKRSRRYPQGYPYPTRINQRDPFMEPALAAKRGEVIREVGRVVDDVAGLW